MGAVETILSPGTVLSGRYRIESVLGQGGMGSVYLARLNTLGDKPVAIKEMRLDTTGSGDKKMQEAAVAQFRQEAQFLANLEHPNLVQVSDFFEENGRSFLVMAYVKGQTLADMLKERRGAFPVQRVLEWATQLTAVLQYLHTQNPPILFRDLKPSNIMQDEAGRIRLIDFGIARVFNPEGATATFLQGMGSAGYSPLEQYQGAGGTDPRSDIYGLGATLYHLLTNRQPPSPVELVASGENMPSPRRWNPTLPPALEKVILKMLSIRKDERQNSMAEVQAALQRIAASIQEEEGSTEALGGVGPIQVQSISAPLPPARSAPSTPYASSGRMGQVPTGMQTGATTVVIGGGSQDKAMWAVAGTLSAAAVAVFAFMAYNVHAGAARPAASASPAVVTTTVAKKPAPPRVSNKPGKPPASQPAQAVYRPPQQPPTQPVAAAPQTRVVVKPSTSPRLPDADVPQAPVRRPKPQTQQPQYPTAAAAAPVEMPQAAPAQQQLPPPPQQSVTVSAETLRKWPAGRPKPGDPLYWNPPSGPDHIAGAPLGPPPAGYNPPPGATMIPPGMQGGQTGPGGGPPPGRGGFDSRPPGY